MSETLGLSAADRVLVFAPHPDDESIACGGLLLAARDAGAERRVIVVTDGDNNPWPQRWIEKRWHIDADARARWGARRRAEAQAALDVLGVDPAQRCFLGLADMGLTDLLMGNSAALVSRLHEQIVEFRPSLIVLPGLADRHPDHSAVHIAARLALLRVEASTSPRLLTFSVHGDADPANRVDVPLNADQVAAKQRSIFSHDTQMRLSRRRFLAYATTVEVYRDQTSLAERPDNLLQARFSAPGALELQVDLRRLRGSLASQHLLVLLERAQGANLRWRVSLANKRAAILDGSPGQVVGTVDWRRENYRQVATVPVPTGPPALAGYVKLARIRPSLFVLDRYQWQELEIPQACLSGLLTKG